MLTVLKNLKGNARTCVYTEPLWGIPYNLFFPYVSVYMLSLGLDDQKIGLVLTIGWGFQILTSLFSGVVTDKLGRRRTTFLFDLISWTVPVVLWAAAQNFAWFVAAAIFNSFWRVPMNSWSCLLVEDCDPRQLLDIYAWIYIAGVLAVFFTPLAGLLVNRFSLVPTMRGLYGLAVALMTVKFILTYVYSHETETGIRRMEETRRQPALSILSEYPAILRQIFRTPETVYTMAVMVIVSVSMMINGSFWSIIVTQKIGIPAEHIAIFPFVKSSLMLAFYLLVIPRLKNMPFKIPMAAGFVIFALSHVLLVTAPEKGYLALAASTLLEAVAFAALNPQLDRLVAVTVDPRERARIQSILYVAVILFTSPFGWVAGTLSAANRNLPFVLNLALFALGTLLVLRAGRYHQPAETATGAAPAGD